jgi:hypothetical protein
MEKESALFDVKVLDEERLELQKLIKQRNRITRKISELPQLEPRIKIENPELTLQQLFERLQRKKTEIDEKIAKYSSSSEQESKTPPLPKPRSFSFREEQYTMSIEEIAENYAARVYPDWRDRFQQSECPMISGTAIPYLTRTGATVSALNDLNHNSSADYVAAQQSWYAGIRYDIAAWLNDDASIWRDDNPDSFMWYDNICIFLPTAECDSKVYAEVAIKFLGRIDSEADDHNEILQYAYVAHSDENGNLPPYVSFGDKYDLNHIDLSGEIGLPYGNSFGSYWAIAEMSFEVKSGAASKVAIGNCTQLEAQDGTLLITGSWIITNLYYSIRPL